MQNLKREQINKLPRADKELALEIAEELERRQRYRADAKLWMNERLGIPIEHIDWALIPEYQSCHCRRCTQAGRVGPHLWDGTYNPLVRLCDNVTNGKWTAVEGGTGTSKTYTMAALCLWFLENFEDSMVVTTAPKERQLEINIWQEIQKFYPKFNRGLLQSLQLKMDPPKDTWVMTAFVAGVRAEEAEGSATKAQGIHRKHLLVIFEETPGINQAVMNAFIATCTAEHNVIIALGNPDHQMDTLHKFAKNSEVDHIVISGFDVPNVVCRQPDMLPGAQTETGLDRLLATFKDPNNPLYLSRGRGISPGQSTDSIIQLEWIRKAQVRTVKTTEVRSLGVDVANSTDGDQAAIAEGIGSICTKVDAFPCPNSNKLGTKIFYRMMTDGIQQQHVGVDGIGVGAGTVNELLRLGKRVENVQSAATPIEVMKNGIKLAEEFSDLRSQMWWQLRMDLQEENSIVVLPDDDELVADLTIPKYETHKNQIRVESKDKIKKRLGRSPNKGDALVYWNWVRARRGTVAAIAMAEKPNDEREAIFQDMLERMQTMEQLNVKRNRIIGD